MRDEIIISKDEYVQLVNALEKVIYVLHRSESRDNPDTRAYSLALGYEEIKIWDDLMAARDILYNAISEKEFDELDDSGSFDFDRISLTDETDIEILREMLRKHIIEWRKVKQQSFEAICNHYDSKINAPNNNILYIGISGIIRSLNLVIIYGLSLSALITAAAVN